MHVPQALTQPSATLLPLESVHLPFLSEVSGLQAPLLLKVKLKMSPMCQMCTGAGLRNPITPLSTERVSRVSFAPDTRISRGSESGVSFAPDTRTSYFRISSFW